VLRDFLAPELTMRILSTKGWVDMDNRGSDVSILISLKSGLLLISGILTCPCHLPFLLPFLAAVLAGTAAGAFIQNHIWAIGIAASVYFVFLVGYAFRKSTQNKASSKLFL